MIEQSQKLINVDNTFIVELSNDPQDLVYWFRAREICDVLFENEDMNECVSKYCQEGQHKMIHCHLYVSEPGVLALLRNSSNSSVSNEVLEWIDEQEDFLQHPVMESFGMFDGYVW